MSADEERRARLKRLRAKLQSSEYRLDERIIADAILARSLARLRASEN